MSRIRSHLENAMTSGQPDPYRYPPSRTQAEPRPAYPAPDRSPAAPAATRELQNIHRTLDELAGRISAMPRNAPQTAPREMMQHTETALRDMRQEMNQGINALREEFAREFHRSNAELSGHLNADLERIAEGIARLQNSGGTHPDYVDQMQAELRNLNDGIRHLSDMQSRMPASQVDLSGVSRSIESGYSEIVNKLDMVLTQRGNELPDVPDYSSDLHDLGRRLDDLTNVIGAMPAANTQFPDYSKDLKALQLRLEEVTRAVVSMTVSPSQSLDAHALERIEARLASLSKSVEELQESGPGSLPDNAMADLAGYQESIAAELSRIAGRLEALEGGGETAPGILADVQAIAGRIDALHADLGVIAANIDHAREGGVSMAPMTAMPDVSGMENGLATLEDRITALADRMEAIGHSANDLADSPNAQSQEVLSVLRDLVGRVESIEDMARSASEAEGYETSDTTAFDVRFEGLENQLSAIASQLGSFQPGSISADAVNLDLQPITERLDHIEGQIAASRDIVLDIATEAARKAAGSISGQAGLDPQVSAQIEELLSELRMQRENGEQGHELGHAMGEIQRAIQDISHRLDGIDSMASYTGYAAAPQFEPQHPQHFETQQAAPAADYSEQDYAAMAPDVDLPHLADAPSMAPGDEEFADIGSHEIHHVNQPETWQDDVSADAPAADQFSAEGQESAVAQLSETENEVEDVPLEPGSGMPDLEALVRRASNRKRSGEERQSSDQGDDDGISELMAAARRAAQAASVQAQTDREKQSTKSEKAGARRLMPKSRPSFLNRKNLMLSAAVVAVALAGWMVVPKLIGGDEPAGNTEISRSAVEPADADMDNAGTLAEGEEAEVSTDDSAPRIVGEEADTAMVDDGPVDGENMEGADNPLEAADGGLEDEPVESDPAVTETANTDMPGVNPEVSAAGDTNLMLAGLPQDAANPALREAAATGNGNALFEIARRFTEGEGVERDLSRAAEIYEQAANSGHAPSQYRLGNFYEKGHGVAADITKAAEWYSKSAAAGNALAMHNLAVLNVQGLLGSDPDMETAIGWFEKAANLGVKDSQVNLGILYTQGMGVQADVEQAYKWFAIAAKGGDNDAASKRDTVAKIMRPDQLERARGEAELWKPKELDRAANIASVEDAWKAGGGERISLSQTELVRRTQFILGKMGYDAGPADGIFGAKTEQAIRDFQQKNGMAVDGRITPELVEKISKLAI